MNRQVAIAVAAMMLLPAPVLAELPVAGAETDMRPALIEAATAGDRIGPLELRDVNGERVSLAGLRGKVVVLNFWATWCQPCVEELPLLASLATRYGDRGFVVVAASIDEAHKRDDLARVAAGLPDGMQVWVGATLEDMARLEIAGALPATMLIDRDGAVTYRKQGALGPGDLDRRIDALLGDAPPTRKPFQAEHARAKSGTVLGESGSDPDFKLDFQ